MTTTTTVTIGPSSLLNTLSDDGLRILVAWLLAISCFLMGIGLERSIGRYLVFHAQTETTVIVYSTLQIMAWPILLLICFLSYSIFGLPFGIVGLFFGGIPYLSYDLALAADTRRTLWSRCLNATRLLANSLHHTGFFLVCSLIVVQQFHPNKSVVMPGIPLLVMHGAALLEPCSIHLYYGMVILSEVWFQCELFAALQEVPTEMKVAFWMLSISHFLFFASNILLLFAPPSLAEEAAFSNNYVVKVVRYLKDATHATTFDRYDKKKDDNIIVPPPPTRESSMHGENELNGEIDLEV